MQTSNQGTQMDLEMEKIGVGVGVGSEIGVG